MTSTSLRHDWRIDEITALFDLPFNDLMFKAQTVHRQYFDANTVQVSTLLSIKTGGCPEDCKYCPQSSRYNTGLNKEALMAVEQVLEHGEFAARGSLLDLFPMGSSRPYRIDFFDDEVDSIRPFDPESQRSSEPVKSVSLLPAREFPTDEAAIELFRGQFREQFELSRAEGSVYQEVSKGRWPAGIEYYLPLFFSQTASLFDYLPDNTLLLTVGEIYPAAQRFWNDIGQRYEDRRWDNTRPLLPPQQIYLPVEQLFAALGRCN